MGRRKPTGKLVNDCPKAAAFSYYGIRTHFFPGTCKDTK